ncbi:2-oxoglutarate oxidoreductase [bacterium]|nr:2-oxoglutarate oxidoreductase [bacterium]
MFGVNETQTVDYSQEYYSLEDYQSSTPRWCSGCGDNAILTAVQRLCRDEQIPPEKAVFVSGIGCSSRFPHYMGTYGFHSLHGRALPIAQGVKLRRPDLKVFVNMGDGDCCSIGTAHWIHAIRYNMNMTAIVHDNEIYGMTKKQASPTTPMGIVTNTTPKGTYMEPLNMLSATLGISNVSFVANAVEWIPEVLYEVIRQAYLHQGFSFVRVVQRCPHFLPNIFDPFLRNPDAIQILTNPGATPMSDSLKSVYKNVVENNPADINQARELSMQKDVMPVGILYQATGVPCYDELRRAPRVVSMEMRKKALEDQFNRFAVNAG